MDQQIIILKSERMDSNKKQGRHENTLVRMPKSVRASLGEKKPLEVSSDNPKNVNVLNVKPYMAYSSDIKKAKELVAAGTLKASDLERIAFVTSSTYDKLKSGGKIFSVCNISDIFKDILIGTDPELLLMNNGNVVPANSIAGLHKESRFGSDGPMAELRPEPAYSPEDLVANMTNIFQNEEFTKNIQNYDWMSACYFKNNKRDYPVGTHIHFDNPAAIRGLSREARERLYAVTNKIIDELLTIPMIRLDGDKGHSRRAKCSWSQANGFGGPPGVGYGFFGEWRSQAGRLEHRSLSGLAIINPEVCEGVFGTAKAICEAVYKEAVNNGLNSEFILPEKYGQKNIYNKTFKSWDKIPLAATFDCTHTSEFMRTIMDKSSRVEVDPNYIKKWLSKIRTLPTYSKYEKYVEQLGDILVSSAKTLDKLDKNIKKSWRL